MENEYEKMLTRYDGASVYSIHFSHLVMAEMLFFVSFFVFFL